MDLSLSQVRHERLDQHGRFTLSDERSSGGHDSFSTGDFERPVEEDGELADEPLDEAPVVKDLDDRDEEDDGRDDTSEEPRQAGNILVGQEDDTGVGGLEKVDSAVGDEAEDVETDACSEHEKRNDELDQVADNDSLPDNLPPVPRGSPETERENCHTKEGDTTVGAVVVRVFRRCERSDKDDSDNKSSAQWDAQLLRNHVVYSATSCVPCRVHWLGEDRDGNP